MGVTLFTSILSPLSNKRPILPVDTEPSDEVFDALDRFAMVTVYLSEGNVVTKARLTKCGAECLKHYTTGRYRALR